jgi:hypothetical protein
MDQMTNIIPRNAQIPLSARDSCSGSGSSNVRKWTEGGRWRKKVIVTIVASAHMILMMLLSDYYRILSPGRRELVPDAWPIKWLPVGASREGGFRDYHKKVNTRNRGETRLHAPSVCQESNLGLFLSGGDEWKVGRQ